MATPSSVIKYRTEFNSQYISNSRRKWLRLVLLEGRVAWISGLHVPWIYECIIKLQSIKADHRPKYYNLATRRLKELQEENRLEVCEQKHEISFNQLNVNMEDINYLLYEMGEYATTVAQ